MVLYLHAIGFGLVTASILALASVGLTLQFGVTNYINFAYGELLTFGAYFAWMFNVQLGWNIWLSLFAAAVFCGIVAVILNILILQPFVRRKSPLLFMLVVTFGLSIILSNVILAIWGPDFKQYTVPNSGQLNIGPFLFTAQQLIIIAIAIIVMLAVHVVLTYTKLGKAMRAMSDNTDLASNCGINTAMVACWSGWCGTGFERLIVSIRFWRRFPLRDLFGGYSGRHWKSLWSNGRRARDRVGNGDIGSLD
jgi:branched-subunit amino acid ABC-type transport system permease component